MKALSQLKKNPPANFETVGIAASIGTCASGAAIVGGVAGKIGEIIDSQRTLIDWKTVLTDK